MTPILEYNPCSNSFMHHHLSVQKRCIHFKRINCYFDIYIYINVADKLLKPFCNYFNKCWLIVNIMLHEVITFFYIHSELPIIKT